MENKIKIGIFCVFFGYIVAGLFIDIPSKINNIIYGSMAVFAVYFVFKYKEEMGLNDIFKKKEEEKEEEKKEESEN